MMRALLRSWILLALVVPIFTGLASATPQGEEDFGGVGVQVVPVTTGELVVIGVLPDSPAAQGGIQPGDFIFAVDGRELKGVEFTEIIDEHLWGPPGSEVILSFLRPGVAGDKKVTLRRVPVKIRDIPTPD